MRIVSLLPSATELICQLGLEESLVGISHACDYPASIVGLPRVTKTQISQTSSSQEIDGTVRNTRKSGDALYTLDCQLMESLRPDLIVTQSLCNVCAVAEDDVQSLVDALPSTPRVLDLHPENLGEVLGCLAELGEAAGCAARALVEIEKLQRRIDVVTERSNEVTERPRAMILEWIDPLYTAGHWNPELVRLAGGHEIMSQTGKKSSVTSWESICDADPEVLVIACCGYDVQRTLVDVPILKSHPEWETLSCCLNDRVYVFDGNAYFSRPGPRLVDCLELLAHVFHPTLHPLPKELPEPLRLET